MSPQLTAMPPGCSSDHGYLTPLAWFVFAGMVALTLPVLPSMAAESGRVAIQVNGETVSVQDFNRRVEAQLRRAGEQADGEEQDPRKKRKQIEARVIDQLVLKLLLKSEVQKEQISVEDGEVDQSWQEMVDRHGSEDKLREKLREIGKTPQELRRDLELSIKFQKFVEQRTSNVEVSDEEARNYMLRNREKFGDKPFEQVKERIKRTLKGKKQQKAVGDLLRSLRDEADIEVNV